MDSYNLPSALLENVIAEFTKLPGIGKKTALRLALHQLNQPQDDVLRFVNAVKEMKTEIKLCKHCYNISEDEVCSICNSTKRDKTTICVVESIKELLAIEATSQYNGVYHILGGRISPMEGIAPNDLNINDLEERVKNNTITEIILALSTNMEGDTTGFYIYRRLNEYNIPISTLARGVAIGDELEYTDEITLGKSIINRTPYNGK